MGNPATASPLQRLLNALSILAGIAGRETIAEYLRMAAVAAGAAADDKAQFDALTAEVQAMVTANRDPTAEEFDAVRARRKDLEAQIAAIPVGGSPPAPPAPEPVPVSASGSADPTMQPGNAQPSGDSPTG